MKTQAHDNTGKVAANSAHCHLKDWLESNKEKRVHVQHQYTVLFYLLLAFCPQRNTMFRIQNLVMTGVNLLDAKNRVAASSRSVFITVIISMLLG
jgi:hypothetical protein